VVAQGGTSISWSSVIAIVVSTSGFPGWNAAGGVVGGLGTLLGPEGAGDASRLVLQRRCLREGVLSYVWDWPDIITRLRGFGSVGVVDVSVGWFCP